MSKTLLIVLISAVFCIILGCTLIGYTVSTLNSEQKLRNLVSAKQVDNTNEFDNMKKKLNQICQLPEAQTQMLMDIIVKNSEVRAAGQGKGSVFAMVQESVPNVNIDIINRLANEITASRNAWTMRQKELIDINREHTDIITTIPSSVICGMFGRNSKIDITVVTSANTKQAFKTGEDNDTDLGLPKRQTKPQKIEQ
jgi:hypothetical protein